MTRSFFRIVKHNPPTKEDFASNAATYPAAVVPDDLIDLWGGVSMFDTRDAVARLIAAMPALGVGIAELDLPDDPSQAGPFAVLSDEPGDDAGGETAPEPPYYELWETRTANLLAGYDTEEDALAVVREMIAFNDREAVAAWALLLRDGPEDTLLAVGDDLAARAEADETEAGE